MQRRTLQRPIGDRNVRRRRSTTGNVSTDDARPTSRGQQRATETVQRAPCDGLAPRDAARCTERPARMALGRRPAGQVHVLARHEGRGRGRCALDVSRRKGATSAPGPGLITVHVGSCVRAPCVHGCRRACACAWACVCLCNVRLCASVLVYLCVCKCVCLCIVRLCVCACACGCASVCLFVSVCVCACRCRSTEAALTRESSLPCFPKARIRHAPNRNNQ